MPKYKYNFCDGTTSEVEVSDEQYALLTAIAELIPLMVSTYVLIMQIRLEIF